MSCISFLNTCPGENDKEQVLLSKILQVLNGTSSVGGVTSVTVNGGAPTTGAVSLTISKNFKDGNSDNDGIAYSDQGVNEVFRTQSGSEHVKFAGHAARIHTTNDTTDQFTFLATDSKSTGAFLEVYGQTHPLGLGGATISIHDNGQFRVRSAPNNSTTSVILFAVDKTSATTTANVVLILGNRVRLKAYTVGTLPAGTEGDVAYVTDASAPAFHATVAAGGSVRTPVFFNGTNWIVI